MLKTDIMFIRVKKRNDGKSAIQIVESVRTEKTVKQKVLRHVGVAHNESELKELLKLGNLVKAQIEEERLPKLFSPEDIAKITPVKPLQNNDLNLKKDEPKEELKDNDLNVNLKNIVEIGRHITGIHDIYGNVFKEFKFDKILPYDSLKRTDIEIIKNLVMARIANPGSKRDAAIRLEEDFGISLDLHKIYRAMDRLDDNAIERIQTNALTLTKTLFKETIDVIFYDCTTLYFERFEDDDFRKCGYSKDLKFSQPQVVLGLMVTKDGLPIGYDIFPGNTYEGHTLMPMILKLKERFQLDKIVFVADSGLLNQENLTFMKENNISYIVGSRLKNLKKEIQKEILNLETYSHPESDIRFKSISLDNKDQLIVQYCSKRARKDAHDREKAISKLQNKMKKCKNPKEYLTNYGSKKYLSLEGESKIKINELKIEEDAKWDGLHGVITNIDWMTPEEIKSQYTGLWQVEESFRINKNDLEIRPIFHFKESRIKAHLAICFMAFCCIRYLEFRIKTQFKKLSPEIIRRELLHVQLSILKDTSTNETYAMPSCVGEYAPKIYQIMKLQKITKPYKIKEPIL